MTLITISTQSWDPSPPAFGVRTDDPRAVHPNRRSTLPHPQHPFQELCMAEKCRYRAGPGCPSAPGRVPPCGTSGAPSRRLERLNQNRRTRAASVARPERSWSGETPAVAQVAEEAQMTRTTVYRYFPNHEALLVELRQRRCRRELRGAARRITRRRHHSSDAPTQGHRRTQPLRRREREALRDRTEALPRHVAVGRNAWANAIVIKCEKDVACAGSQPPWHRYATPCLTPTYDA